MKSSRSVQWLGVIAMTAFVGVSFVGCGGDDNQTATSGGASGSSSGGSSGASNGERYAETLCDLIFNCCDQTGIDERFASVGDYGGCRIAFRTIYDGAREPTAMASEAAGRSSFSQANFDACIEKLKTASCADLEVGNIDGCSDISIAKVPLGGVCEANIDCVDGTCSIPNGAAQGTCATKEPAITAGGDCSGGKQCDKGLYCNAGVCALRLADDSPCSDHNQCTSGTCVGNNGSGMGICGSVCKGNGAGRGPTNTNLEELGPLMAQAQCTTAANCCTPDEFAATVFPGINNEWECLGLYATFVGIGLAELNSSAADGKLSLDGPKLVQCAEQYKNQSCTDYSQVKTFECPDAIKGLVPNGGSCTDNVQCVSKYCDESGANPICADLPGAGAACTNECVDGYYCAMGMCAAKKAVGTACSGSRECADSRCAGPTGMKTCSLICDGT